MRRPIRRASLALGLCLTTLPAVTAAQTGRAAEPYDSYPAPATCVSVVNREILRATWEYPFDTLPFNPARRVPELAQAAGRDCLGKVSPGITVRSAADRDVAALFLMGRGFADDTLARQAWSRALRQQRIRDDSTDVIWHLLQSYANGSPPDLVLARRMAHWLDTLGVIGERPMLPGDSLWVSQHEGYNYLAQSVFDTAAMRAAVAGIRRNFAGLPVTGRGGAYRSQVAAQAEELLLELVENPRSDSAVAALKAKALEMLGPKQEEQGWGGGLLLLGQKFGPLHPDYWFGLPPGDSTIPRPGRVTLVQFIDPHSCVCDVQNAATHRLKARFGDSLDFVFITQTAGHIARRVQVPPAEEAELLARHIRDTWKLDAAVAVYVTTFVPNPAPDLRLVPQVIPELRHIRYGYSPMVVDRRGIFVLSGFSPAEAALTRLIEGLLRAPAPAEASAGGLSTPAR